MWKYLGIFCFSAERVYTFCWSKIKVLYFQLGPKIFLFYFSVILLMPCLSFFNFHIFLMVIILFHLYHKMNIVYTLPFSWYHLGDGEPKSPKISPCCKNEPIVNHRLLAGSKSFSCKITSGLQGWRVCHCFGLNL